MKFRKTLIFLVIIFLAACGNEIDANMSETMVDFEFKTQDETSLNLENLKDDWWVANFMYTNCRAVCPKTTANLANVQEELKIDDLHPRIVSFSVDPAHDTPDVLREYADNFGADLESWSFLTGYEFETIQDIAQETFKFHLSEGALDQRAHGYNFYLINPDGEIIKEYDGLRPDDLEVLVDDLRNVL